MKLAELSPRWIYKRKVFAFICPHCRKVWLTCKRVVMPSPKQWAIFADEFDCEVVVGCKPDVAWKFKGDEEFTTISVTPSLDASPAGHWHGHITNGEIVGGEIYTPSA